MSQPERSHFTPDELATMSGLSRSLVYRKIQDGTIPHVRPTGTSRLLVPVADALLWLSGDSESVTLADVIPFRRR